MGLKLLHALRMDASVPKRNAAQHTLVIGIWMIFSSLSDTMSLGEMGVYHSRSNVPYLSRGIDNRVLYALDSCANAMMTSRREAFNRAY